MTIPAAPPSHVTLPSGNKMPTLGLGCWQSPPEQLASAVEHAIKAGYKHIDGATIYGNEEALGDGIRRSGVDRKDLWVTTKLWNTDHKPEDVLPALQRSLKRLGTDYLDLWLMHYPAATDPNDPKDKITVIDVPFTETWKAMEACVKQGLVRNIGISNYSKGEVEQLLKVAEIRPALHQLEKHPYLPQNAFCKWHKEIGLHITAYSPLGNTNPSFAKQDKFPQCQENPAVVELSKKYGITPANVLISLQLSEGHSVLPKSVTPSRITENLKVVQLSDEDLQSLYKAFEGKRHRYCDFSEIIGYKYYADLDDSN